MRKLLLIEMLLFGATGLFAGAHTEMTPEDDQVASENTTFTGNLTAAARADSFNCKYFESIRCIDSADSGGWTGSELGAWIGAAYSDLPSCTDSQSNNFTHCGTIWLFPGTYTWSSQQTISSPYVSIIATTPTATQINYTGTSASSCALNVTSKPFTANTMTGKYAGFILKGNSAANICGIRFYDIEGFQLEASISNFTGSGAIGLLQANVANHTERANLHVWLDNNRIGWEQTTQEGSSTTMGYGDFIVHCSSNAGQTCFSEVGGGGVQLIFSESNVHMICNLVNAATCISEANNAQWRNNYTLEIEQTAGAGATARSIDGTSSWYGIGYLYINPSNMMDSSSKDQSTSTGFFPAGTPQLNLFTAGFPETSAVNGKANDDVCYGASAAHALECSYNNDAFAVVPKINNFPLVTNYNALATVGNGFSATYFQDDQAGLVATRGPITALTGTASSGGHWNLCYVEEVTTSDASGRTIVFSMNYTSHGVSRIFTGSTVALASTANSERNCVDISVDNRTDVTYTVIASGAFTKAQYAVDVWMKKE